MHPSKCRVVSRKRPDLLQIASPQLRALQVFCARHTLAVAITSHPTGTCTHEMHPAVAK